MSANNFYYVHQIGNKFYGWDETAEETTSDNGARTLRLSEADVVADNLSKLENLLNAASAIGYSEYGIHSQPYLPKDGTPIEVIDDSDDKMAKTSKPASIFSIKTDKPVTITHQEPGSTIATAVALYNDWLRWCKEVGISGHVVVMIPKLFTTKDGGIKL